MTAIPTGEKVFTVTRDCVFCAEHQVVSIPKVSYDLWKDGVFIQKAWPQGSAGDREMLISGVCSECWDSLFA